MFISVTILESESPSSKASVLCRRTYDRVTADLVEKGNERDAEKKKYQKPIKFSSLLLWDFHTIWFHHIPLTYPQLFPNPPIFPHSPTFIAFFFFLNHFRSLCTACIYLGAWSSKSICTYELPAVQTANTRSGQAQASPVKWPLEESLELYH